MNSHLSTSRYRFLRERRYPVLTALDTFLHWALTILVVAFTIACLSMVVFTIKPDWKNQAQSFAIQTWSQITKAPIRR